MNLKDLPIIGLLADMIKDYPLASGGLIMLVAALVPYIGIENANGLQDALFNFALVIAGGGSLYDAIAKWKRPDID